MKRLRHPIRAIREPFGTAGLIIAMVALVAALGGSALAASGALTGKQKKEVETIAKKYAGKPGAAGPTGTQGPAGAKGDSGPAGAAGTNGTAGTAGTNGTSVTTAVIPTSSATCGHNGGTEVKSASATTNVCNGEEGEEGEEGTEGQPAGFNYTFSTSVTETDPGVGKLALNNATAGSATKLSISETDADANGFASVINGWITGPTAKGTLLIRKAGEPAVFAEYTITGENKAEGAPTTFNNVVVTSVASNGSFANGDAVTIAYWSSATTTLPVGATESGTWSFSGTEAENGSGVKEQEGILAPVSFPIPLEKGVPRERVFFPGDSGWDEHCGTASAGSPGVVSAEYEGQLKTTVCFFLEESNLVHRGAFVNVWKADFSDVGLTKAGGVLQFEATEPGLAYGVGGWAVQAH